MMSGLLQAISQRILGRTPQLHSLIRANRDFFQALDQAQPMECYEFVVLDTELTGFDTKSDEIVSIGALRIRGLQIVPGENFYTLIRPKKNLPKDSTLVHRITPQDLEAAPSIEEVLPEFVSFCSTGLLVGHFIELDMGFINRETTRYMGGTLANPAIDTLRLVQRYKEKVCGLANERFCFNSSYRLDDLVKEYGLPAFVSHDALQDAMQTAYLFLFLVKNLQKNGFHTLKDLFLAGKVKRWLV